MKTYTVTIFQKGDVVRIKLPKGVKEGSHTGYWSGDVGIVTQDQRAGSDTVYVNFIGFHRRHKTERRGYSVDSSEVTPIPKAAAAKILASLPPIPKPMDDKGINMALGHEIVANYDANQFEIGCKRLTADQAAKIAKFFLEEGKKFKTTKKKATKKRK